MADSGDISGVGYGGQQFGSGFNFNVPGLDKTTDQLAGLNREVRNLMSSLQEMSSNQAQMMSGMRSIFDDMSSGARQAQNFTHALNSGIGSSGSTSTGIPYAMSPPMGMGGGGGGGSNALQSSLSPSSNDNALTGLVRLMQLPIKYAFNRTEEARANAVGIADMLSTTSTSTGSSIQELISTLSEGTPIRGHLSDILGTLQSASSIGYGNLDSPRSGSYFEGLRQMQSITPGIGGQQLASMQNQWLGNTQGHQRSLMLTGGAMSAFGAGGQPKTLQEWSESVLRFFEGQRPGSDRGKPFTKIQLETQQFPGSNMDAWFSVNGVPEYMRQYFWQYALGKAGQTGSSQGEINFGEVIGVRGENLASERLDTNTAQARRDFQMISTTNALIGGTPLYDSFVDREVMDRRFESAMGQIDKLITKLLGPFAPLIAHMPTPLANVLNTTFTEALPPAIGSIAAFFLGDPGHGPKGGRRGKSPNIGDVYGSYGSYGGTDLAGLDPSFADKVAAMMMDNPNLQIVSGFRDGALQGRLHEAGIGWTAPAGQSMHGRGLAADLGPESEYGWIAANAHVYGLDSGIGHGEPWHVGAPGTVPHVGIGDPNAQEDSGGGGILSKIGGAVGRGVDWVTNPAGAVSDIAGFATGQGMGESSLASMGSAVGGGIGGILGNLLDVGSWIFKGIKGIGSLLSGDLSGLFGEGGMFDMSNLISKVFDGIMGITGLDSMFKSEDPTASFAGMMGGTSGQLQPTQVSSLGQFNQMVDSGGAGAAGGAGYMPGVGGGSVSPADVSRILQAHGGGSNPAAYNPSEAERNKILATLQAAHGAGFSGDSLIVMGALAGRESRWNPMAHNPNRGTGDNSYGLWQINMIDSIGPARRKQYGLSSNEDLFRPEVNARVAWDMTKQGTNFRDWGGFKGKPTLYSAQQYVQPVYNIAKQAGMVGDPSRFRQTHGQSAQSPQGNTYHVSNDFTIQVTGNRGDAERVAGVISSHINDSIQPHREYVSR